MNAVRIPPAAMAPLPPVELDRARVQAMMDKVRRLELRTRGLVTTSLVGSYASAFRGRGIDFDQVREYVPGDEVRTIDWNVTARAGRPFVKEFREERELSLVLVVDVSASGDFGSTTHRKRELVTELACVLALSAVRANDLVGLVLFSDRIERFVPPGKGRMHVLRIVRELLGCQPVGHGTDVALALELAGAFAGHRSVITLISDLELGGPRTERLAALERVARPLGARHDVLALRVRDPHERELPDLGLVGLEDAETGEVVYLDTARRKVRKRFAELAQQRAAEVERVLRNSRVELLDLDTAHDFLPTLHACFARRGRRR